MAGSVNKMVVLGNVGRDPETRTMQSGGKVVTFSVATSESWKDKDGQKQEKTQWHRIAIFNERLGEIAERYVKKGSKVYLEGRLESRKYTDKDGNERETFEVVLPRFGGELTLLGDNNGSGDSDRQESRGSNGGGGRGGYSNGGGRSNYGNGGGRGNGGGGGWDSPRGGGNTGRGSASNDLDDDIPFSKQWQ